MKEFAKSYKRQEGITLVALVITVVVMLILAGVAIAAVVDGDGLFSKTRQAAETYENAARNEGDTIQSMINQIDEYLGNKNTGTGDGDGDDNNPPAGGATIGEIVDENKTFDGQTTGTYNNPIIPKGFAPVENAQDSTITTGAEWGSAEGYKYGLVIEDANENQFVWVPVDGTIVKFERYEFGKGTSMSSCSEEIPTEITASITNNQGFYIARFEAGKPETGNLATDGTVKPVSKQDATVWNNIKWSESDTNDDINPGNGAVTVARSMYLKEDTNYGVASTLIYGTQWDTALKFIGAYNVGENGYDTYATNSIGMGNYKGTNGADDIASTSVPAECGAREGFRQKNIYDMAGNVWEWTMEKYRTGRVYRGGSYYSFGSEFPASLRNIISVDYADSNHGFRVGLYIKQL